MKTSAVLASLLFGSFAVAAPVDRRALVYHTEIVTETVVVYTTIYDDDVPEASATPEGLFYEQQPTSAVAEPTSAVVEPTTSAAPAPVDTTTAVAEAPSSVYQAPPPPPPQTPTPAPAPVPQTTEEAKPITTEAPYVAPEPAPAPAPVTTSAAPVYQPPAPVEAPVVNDPAPVSGEKFSDVDITIYDNNGGYGACGTILHDSDMIVALAQPAWGASTYDVMTGAATNPWCGQKIQIEYQGNSIQATIMDLCPGCVGHDVDLSLSAWKALTGLDEKTRLKASWSKIS